MLDDHAESLPDHSLLHHTSVLDLGDHHVPVHDAAVMSEILRAVAHELPSRAAHAADPIATLIHAAFDSADKFVQGHDALVDLHHHLPDPFGPQG